jgi:L-asparaginase/Glu-tRNA(Gln) amidotransferase subunit D
MSLRLLKESIMSSDETMKCIGNFIDRGKKVFIKSQTVKGKVNLSLYENGQKLQVLGTIELEETEFHSRNKIFKRVRN